MEHKGEVDLVTETDKACEELIFNHLKQRYPSHKVRVSVTVSSWEDSLLLSGLL